MVHLTYEVILNESSRSTARADQAGARRQTASVENPTGSAGVSGCPDGTSDACSPTTGFRVRYTSVP